MKEYSGILEVEETASGSKFWLYHGDFTKKEWSREFLIPVETGDYLIILNYTRKILWKSQVKLQDSKQGWDMPISYERWEKFFFKQFSAILIKNDRTRT